MTVNTVSFIQLLTFADCCIVSNSGWTVTGTGIIQGPVKTTLIPETRLRTTQAAMPGLHREALAG